MLRNAVKVRSATNVVARNTFHKSIVGRNLHSQQVLRTLIPTKRFATLPQFASTQYKQTQWINQFNQISIARRGFASDLPTHSELGLPALSPTMEQGNIAKWKKKEGDKLSPGDAIAEIETDKATVDFEATDEGYLAKILYPDGTKDLTVGTPIAIIVEDPKDIAAFKDYKSGAKPKAAEAPKAEPTPAPAAEPAKQEAPKAAAPSAPQQPQAPQGRFVPGLPPPPAPRSGAASPAARSTAAEQGIPLSSVKGTGPDGRIIKADVLEAPKTAPRTSAAAAAAPSASSAFTDIPNTQIRRVIASRLSLSKQTIPHYYLTMECRVDELSKLRQHLNEKAGGKFKLSVNDFVIKAAALACKKVPEVNSSWTDDAIRRYHNVDINVAVSTDRGLLTPLIPGADKLGLGTINNSVKTLAEKAKDNKLTPADLSTGTFTISNLGMFGIKSFSAVINPPQACILAVGTTEQRVVVNESVNKENPYSVASYMSVTLSCDHRVVDGAVGAQWLQAFKEYIEDPSKMLL